MTPTQKESRRMAIRRILRGELFMVGGFVLAAAVTIAFVVPPSIGPTAAQPTTQTSSGPLTAADRDLLVKVRQAGLWEMPSGEFAETRAEAPRVKEVGRLIMSEHQKLDQLTRDAAAKLGVPLPDEANPDQQRWVAQLKGESGAAFDRDFVNLLRAAHGKVFTVIAGVRSGTRNAEVRKFAQECINFVMRHMTYLESTGLVNHNDLPEAPTPA